MVIYEELHLVPSLLKAHGSVMGIAFVIIFPLGAWLVRFQGPRKSIWTHLSIQIVGLVLMLAGLGTGIKQGTILDLVCGMSLMSFFWSYEIDGRLTRTDTLLQLHNNTHTILGTVVVVCMLLQPLFGLIHHLRFRKLQRRTIWSLIHTWYGRAFILLGIIDGGLGIRLANNTMAGEIVYGVIAGISGVAFIGLIIWSEIKKRKESSSSHEDSRNGQMTQHDGSTEQNKT